MRAARERALAAFAKARDDIVTVDELRRFGVERGALRRRVQSGRLHRRHRGVYVLGTGTITQRGRWRAAVAACGKGALLGRLSATGLWGILEDERTVVDVVAASAKRSRPGIRVHQVRDLTDADRALQHGIPLTSMARTLVDIAGFVPTRTLEKAVREAEREGLLDVEATLARCAPGRAGSGALRAILRRDFAPALGTRSELELRFVEV